MTREGTTSQAPLLVTGATGYVGGRLVRRLLEQGHRVRATSRSLDKLRARPWAGHPRLELIEMDALEPEQVGSALSGCSTAYYLIHSMEPRAGDFSEIDRQAASTFRDCAAEAGLERIVYLGGLGDTEGELSEHLRSRQEVADLLAAGPVPTTVLRASMIVGAGSASFEILRHLVEKLPVMITPRWVRTRTQPISIENVLDYLARCADDDRIEAGRFDIGGSEILTYEELMQTYARVAGLRKRLMISVPVLSPKLSSYWIHLVTPVTAALARPLVEGLRNEMLVDPERDLHRRFPEIGLDDLETSIRRALDSAQRHDVETYWSDAGKLPPEAAIYPGDPEWAGTTYVDRHRVVLEGSPEDAWEPILRIGGANGYYYGNFLWAIRGTLDLLFGGPGLRRGRRDPENLRPGDALDFWRVVRVDPPRDLKLFAEMRLPGKAWLDFSVRAENGRTVVYQTASFEPRGLPGRLYWWLVWPLHHFVFAGMLRGLARASGRPVVQGPHRAPLPEG